MVRRIGLVAAMIATLVGCDHFGSHAAANFPTVEDLSPSRPPPTKETLTLGGVELPVTLKSMRSGSQLSISIESCGSNCETERYDSTKDRFSLVQAAGESYIPPIPLLAFPLTVGNKTEWVGSLSAGNSPSKATATVATSLDQQFGPSSSEQTVKVVVDLTITNSDGHEAKRELIFWFDREHGLFHRKFGTSSERMAVRP